MLNKRRLWIIAASVLLAHLCLIGWLEWGAMPKQYKPPQDKLIIKTVRLVPEKKTGKIAESSSPPVKKTAPKKPKPPVKKKEEKAKPPIKKKESKAKPQKETSKQESKKSDLIAQARERLSQVGKMSKSLDQAKGIESLKIDSLEGGVEDQGYYSQLAACLRLNLRLPEFGEVKVHLTIDCKGKPIHVKIVNAQNENNKRYVEKILPKVDFPPFDKAFKNEKEHTFSITLANDL